MTAAVTAVALQGGGSTVDDAGAKGSKATETEMVALTVPSSAMTPEPRKSQRLKKRADISDAGKDTTVAAANDGDVDRARAEADIEADVAAAKSKPQAPPPPPPPPPPSNSRRNRGRQISGAVGNDDEQSGNNTKTRDGARGSHRGYEATIKGNKKRDLSTDRAVAQQWEDQAGRAEGGKRAKSQKKDHTKSVEIPKQDSTVKVAARIRLRLLRPRPRRPHYMIK